MSDKILMVEVEYSKTLEVDYKHPHDFYIRNCLGNFVYFQTKVRSKAQDKCDEVYGKGKYKVNAAKIKKQDKPLTCRGVATRRGQKK